MKIELENMVKLAQSTAMDAWGPREPTKILEKLREETDELDEALSDLDQFKSSSHKFEVLKEFGDTLFCLIRFADQLDIDPGEALSLTLVKIQERMKFNLTKKAEEYED